MIKPLALFSCVHKPSKTGKLKATTTVGARSKISSLVLKHASKVAESSSNCRSKSRGPDSKVWLAA